MSIYRSYFSKNDTIIKDNYTNNSQNPVTEVSYGTENKQVSRFIFDVDLTELQTKINNGEINQNLISGHTLHLTNTIRYADQYVGKKSYTLDIDRASGFELELFNISESWDEGSGYDLEYTYGGVPYTDVAQPNLQVDAANWYQRTSLLNWTVSGASYTSGGTDIIGSQYFTSGGENLEIDVTDYINQRLFGTGYTGTSSYTGDSYGLGLKFTDDYEALETVFRQAVAFHGKKTNTFYEPYIETTINDTITDDRNYFYQDKDNDLYLYVNVGGIQQNITVNSVAIYDYEDNLILVENIKTLKYLLIKFVNLF